MKDETLCRKLGIALGMLLAGCLPAAAQSQVLPAQAASATLPSFLLAVNHASPRLALAYSGPVRLSPAPAVASMDGSRIAELRSTYESIRTSFGQLTRLPVMNLYGGRLQLACFKSAQPMQNVLWGLTASGGASAGGGPQRSHPGMFAPRDTKSFGLSLTFSLKRDAQFSPLSHVLHRLAGLAVGRN